MTITVEQLNALQAKLKKNHGMKFEVKEIGQEFALFTITKKIEGRMSLPALIENDFLGELDAPPEASIEFVGTVRVTYPPREMEPRA